MNSIHIGFNGSVYVRVTAASRAAQVGGNPCTAWSLPRASLHVRACLEACTQIGYVALPPRSLAHTGARNAI